MIIISVVIRLTIRVDDWFVVIILHLCLGCLIDSMARMWVVIVVNFRVPTHYFLILLDATLIIVHVNFIITVIIPHHSVNV